ncbi:MAG: hypothetical protein QGG42_05415 [Phycisphaerae bacterium]|nr:hypothetical protein [Phycisphaerae bacterium]
MRVTTTTEGIRLIAWILLWIAVVSVPADARAEDRRAEYSKSSLASKKGRTSVVTEKEVDPRYIRDICKRSKWKYEANNDSLRAGNYSWDVYVPPSDKEELPGVCVYVSPAGGAFTGVGRWKRLMDKGNLIYIASRDSGNNVRTTHRIALTLRAIDIVKERYKINHKRVYVCGDSGGGRISSMVAPLYPETITGAIYSIGCNYWSNVRAEGNKYWRGFLGTRAVLPGMTEVRKNRYVFLTGDSDANMPQTKANHKAYIRSGVKNCVYVQVKGMGHSSPPPEYWQAAFAYLDGKTSKIAGAGSEANPDDKAPHPGSKPTSRPKRTDEDRARSQLSLAMNYIDAGLKAKAKAVLKQLIAKYPKTQSAKTATAELDKLGKQ